MNTQFTRIEGRALKATRTWIVAIAFCTLLTLTSIASSETPSSEQIIAEAKARIAQRHQIGEQIEARFSSGSRSSGQDAASEARLGEAIAAGLKNHDSQASVEYFECHESICKARIQVSKPSDRGAAMFALLNTHDCGLTVSDADDDSNATLVAYLDCSRR